MGTTCYEEHNAILELTVEVDHQGRFLHTNRHDSVLLGYTPEDLAAGRSLFDLISKRDQKRAIENMTRILKGERHGLNHYVLLNKSGDSYPALIHSRPRNDRHGLQCTIFLLPPSSRLAALLFEHRQIVQTVMGTLPCGIVMVDTKGQISYWNAEAERITGLNRSEAIGNKCHEIFNCRDYKTLCPLHKAPKGSVEPIRKNIVISCKGRSIHLHKISNFIYSENGTVTGAIETFVDQTQQHDAEAALSEARDLLDLARKAKRHFLANMNHEIRTPINGILGILDLMLSEETTSAQREYINTAKRSARILMELFENIMDFSIIEKGAMKIELSGFSLNSVIASVTAQQYNLIQNKEICIHSYVDDDVPDNILGDSGRLYQILRHLVGNSIKFTPTGEVAVHVSLVPLLKADTDDDPRKLMLHFSISDTGVGIPKDKLDLIFEALSQLDESSTRSVGGLGIGLSTVRRLVQLLEGRIWMESEFNKGTTVHVILPFKKTSLNTGDYPQPAFRKPKISDSADPMKDVSSDQKGRIFIGPQDRCRLLAPAPLSANWYLKFKELEGMLDTHQEAAEKLIFNLKQKAGNSNQLSVERLLLRLLLAVRREDKRAANHFYAVLKRKLSSVEYDDRTKSIEGELYENIDRRR